MSLRWQAFTLEQDLPVKDLLLRFVIGGAVVSAFVALGAALKPKSFAGLFGAAPSVALATLGLTVAVQGRLYAAQEARSMMGGAGAFFLYAWFASRLMMRYKPPTLFATVARRGRAATKQDAPRRFPA